MLVTCGGEASVFAAASMPTKTCSLCGVTKPLSGFHLLRRSKDGRQKRCKACACAIARQWTRENCDRLRDNKREYYHKNKGRLRECHQKWFAEHPERTLGYGRKSWAKNRDKRNERKRAYRAANKKKLREYYVQYHAERPELKNLWDAERRAQEIMAMPPWADRAEINAIYRAAKEKTKQTGMAWHVDHIIPLKHKLVCGLHVPQNLQVIPGEENARKSNRFCV